MSIVPHVKGFSLGVKHLLDPKLEKIQNANRYWAAVVPSPLPHRPQASPLIFTGRTETEVDQLLFDCRENDVEYVLRGHASIYHDNSPRFQGRYDEWHDADILAGSCLSIERVAAAYVRHVEELAASPLSDQE